MSSCHCYSQSDTFNLTLLFSPRLHGGLFQLFYGNYDIVSPVSWVNYCQSKQAMPLYAIFYYFAAKVNSLRNFYITLLSWMFLPWNWEKQAYHHLGNESSNREKSHTSCERNDQKLIGAAKWRMTFWLKSVPAFFEALRPSGKFFLLVLQKRLRRCALTWSIWTAFVCHIAIWLIGTSWEYFHQFFPEMQEVGRRLLSKTVCQIRGHCHINKLEVWTTWHARFSHTFVMPHF